MCTYMHVHMRTYTHTQTHLQTNTRSPTTQEYFKGIIQKIFLSYRTPIV